MGNNTRAVEMHPDKIAHRLATADGDSVRIFLNSPIQVPLDPIPERGSVEVVDVDAEYFDAKIDILDVADAGETFWARFHLPKQQWEKLRLHEHWEAETAESWRGKRYIECWASRAPNYDEYDADEYESPVPADSPTVTAVAESSFDVETPPAPFDRPSLSFEAVTDESVRDYGNAWTQQDLGPVRAVTVLNDQTLDPEPRDEEDPRQHPNPAPQQNSIEYGEVEPLTPTEELLDAVYTINRHAKRLDQEADEHYQIGKGAEARVAAVRKDALYTAKTVAVHRFVKADPDAVEVRRHELNGGVEMYCLYFDGVSFHQPLDAVDDVLLDAVGADADQSDSEPIDFSPSADTESLPFSLDEAVAILAEVGIDVNDYLRASEVEDYDWGYRISTQFETS